MNPKAFKFVTLAAMLGALLATGEAWPGDLDTGIAIRGIGATKTCSAKTVVPHDNQVDGRADNLSVNCTDVTDKIDDYATYTAGMVHTKFCVAQIKKIKLKGGSVKIDKRVGNKYHCLVNNIKAKDLANLMTEKP